MSTGNKRITVGDDILKTDFSVPPGDPVGQDDYRSLYRLYAKLNATLEKGPPPNADDPDFVEWDKSVLELLSAEETERYNNPLRPRLADVPGCGSGDPYSRSFHLVKILRARQSWEKKHMSDTGY